MAQYWKGKFFSNNIVYFNVEENLRLANVKAL
jgi:hypothetical protein